MKMRGILTLITMVAFFLMCSTQDLRAATEGKQAQTAGTHAVSQSDLLQAVQDSQRQGSEALKSVQDFLSLQEVKAQIQRLGLAPEKLKVQVAMLNDGELVKLQKQIMSLEVQKDTAGMWKGTKWVVMGVLILVVALVLISTISDASNV